MSHVSSVAPSVPISALVSDLDQLAADVMADWKVPGVALAVVQDGKVALTRAYGQRDVEADLPVTPATQFVICSITKSFTATAIALLHHVSLSAPLEPTVKDIVFARLAAGDCTDPAFRARCIGHFKGGAITHRVALDSEGRLTLKPDYQPTYRLAPEQGRSFRIVELEGFVVEFRGEGTAVDEVIFHQPNGTFVAQRVEE